MSKIDLHIHSSMSDDGEFSPSEIVRQCKAQGMALVSITDHNSVRGVAEAQAVADGLCILSGVELDCTHQGKGFHLLGYGFDHTLEAFATVEQRIIRQEQEAAKKKIRLFQEATGIPVAESEVLAAAKNGIVTGELIAEIVLAWEDAARFEALQPYLPGGTRSDMPNVRFYWDFFAEGKPAYVPIHYPTLSDAAALIHKAGGVAVLAHPRQNLGRDEAMLQGISAAGIDGIEVFSSYHTQEDAAYYLAFAQKHNLFITGGSDFHGKHKPQIALGGHGATWSDHDLQASIQAHL